MKDILAHIAGWQHQMTGAMERMARGEKPTPEGVDYSDADGWNARFAAAMRTQSATTVVADLQQSFANYKRAAAAIADDRYGEGKTVNRLLETQRLRPLPRAPARDQGVRREGHCLTRRATCRRRLCASKLRSRTLAA